MFAPFGWPDDALDRLCGQQHDLQERHIATHHPDADRRIILASGKAVGRLCIDRGSDIWRIVDVVLVPEAQRRGIGSAAIRLVLAEAETEGASVDLHVGRENTSAEALYRRLGFIDAMSASQTHLRLIRPARSRAEPAPA